MRVLPLLLVLGCAPTVAAPEVDPPTEKRTSPGGVDLGLRVEPEHDGGRPYDRSVWLPRWGDSDDDCQDTRAEVLAAESEVPVELDARGCRVLIGRWRCPYTGEVFTAATAVQIDHLVALKEAHDSGGWAWSPDRRRAFAEDAAHLVVVSRSANASKSDRDPAEWTPPAGDRCAYVRAWATVKVRWDLAADQAEADVIASCAQR